MKLVYDLGGLGMIERFTGAPSVHSGDSAVLNSTPPAGPRRHRVQLAAAVVVAVLGGALPLISLSPAAAVTSPVGPNSNVYWVSGTNLVERTPTGTVSTVAPTGGLYETLAANPVDGYLYGIQKILGGTPRIHRISADGSTQDLGIPSGLAAAPPLAYYSVGAFDDAGTLWIRSGSGLFSVNLATMVATQLVTSGVGLPAGDLAYIGGALWGISTPPNPRVVRIDVTTGITTQSNPVTGLGAATSAWSFDSHLYAGGGSGNTLWEIINFSSADPTVLSLATVTSLDGASFPASPNPFLSADNDDYTATPLSTAGGTIGTTLTNDLFHGVVATPADVVTALVNDGGLTGATLDGDGRVTVPAGATPGTYTLTYSICALATPQLCDTATILVAVVAPITPAGTDPAAPTLPRTGAGAAAPLGAGGGLVASGLIALLILRRLRRERSSSVS